MKSDKNILLVGFGVSGLCVSTFLKHYNCSFKIIDNSSQFASKAAGGLINPLSLKRLKPIWEIDTFFPHAVSFYKQHFLKYFTELPIIRIFSSIEEQNDWFSKADDYRLAPYLSSKLLSSKKGIVSNFKLGQVLSSATIDLSKCLNDTKQQLIKQKIFIESDFKYSSINFLDGKVIYNEEYFDAIIFAEGFGVVNNPYFNSLPIYGNHGEYILVSLPTLKSLPIIKGKHFLIPLSDEGIYKFGATYNRNIQENITTRAATELLSDSLSKMISEPFEVVGQVAGIRPTTKDRHPVVGRHSELPPLAIINGMGSRGVVCAPFLAEQLVRNLLYNESLMEEASVERFKI